MNKQKMYFLIVKNKLNLYYIKHFSCEHVSGSCSWSIVLNDYEDKRNEVKLMIEMSKRMKLYRVLPRGLAMVLMVGVSSILGLVFHEYHIPETNIVIVYLLGVVLVSWWIEGFMFGILASFLSTLTFNFLFAVPYYTLTVNDPSYIITFIIMTLTAVITSTLTSHAKQSASDALEREAEIRAVYELMNHLSDKYLLEEIVEATVKIISKHFNCRAGVLPFDIEGKPYHTYTQQIDTYTIKHRELSNQDRYSLEKLKNKKGYYIDTSFYNWPIKGRDRVLGIVRIPITRAELFTDQEIELLVSMIESIALAVDRFWSFEAKYQERERSKHERYRSILLRSISHDLRTPLSGVMGSLEMLIDMTDVSDKRHPILKQAYVEITWLHGILENILNLTRLQEGKVKVNKQWEVAEEVIGSAVMRVTQRLVNDRLTVNVPEQAVMIPMDARLIEQVLVNLLDNAIKHTTLNEGITVTVTKDSEKNEAIFTVMDEGAGILKQDLPHIFEMFHTSEASDRNEKTGIGLGLAICETIVNAHKGHITARNRHDRQGSIFSFILPLGGGSDDA